MKIYIASRSKNRERLLDLAKQLVSDGHTVTSSWILHQMEDQKGTRKEIAVQDLTEIDESDCLILFTHDCEAVPGGLWFEAGYAYARNKPVFLAGPAINIFCELLPLWSACSDQFARTLEVY